MLTKPLRVGPVKGSHATNDMIYMSVIFSLQTRGLIYRLPWFKPVTEHYRSIESDHRVVQFTCFTPGSWTFRTENKPTTSPEQLNLMLVQRFSHPRRCYWVVRGHEPELRHEIEWGDFCEDLVGHEPCVSSAQAERGVSSFQEREQLLNSFAFDSGHRQCHRLQEIVRNQMQSSVKHTIT